MTSHRILSKTAPVLACFALGLVGLTTPAGASPAHHGDSDAHGDVASHCHTGSKGRGAGGEDRHGCSSSSTSTTTTTRPVHETGTVPTEPIVTSTPGHETSTVSAGPRPSTVLGVLPPAPTQTATPGILHFTG